MFHNHHQQNSSSTIHVLDDLHFLYSTNETIATRPIPVGNSNHQEHGLLNWNFAVQNSGVLHIEYASSVTNNVDENKEYVSIIYSRKGMEGRTPPLQNNFDIYDNATNETVQIDGEINVSYRFSM